ncbi:hypothetical protein Tco_1485405 [Tanacetum coccineum]
MAKKIDTGLDVEEEINTGREEINTGIEERLLRCKLLDEEVAKQIHLDKMVAKRMAEEEALTEQQKKRKAQVQFEAQFYTEEDWDTISAKLEANAELSKDMLGQDLPEQDFAKRMVDMVNQRKKHFAEEIAKAKRNKPMTQSQLKKSLINVPAIGEKVAEVKEEEQVKRTGKRKKQKAKKGINVDKSAQEDLETDKEELVEAMNPTPLTTKSDIYMSFGAMIKDFTREDLIELYGLVMQTYGINRPEDAYDRVLWSDLRTMFDPPLIEDVIWSLPLQQKMVSWRLPMHTLLYNEALTNSNCKGHGKDISNPLMAGSLPKTIKPT